MVELLRNSSSFGRTKQEGTRQAFGASVALLFWLAVFATLFPAAALGAFRVWVVSPTFNHCFLIVPLSLFLVWHRREWLAHLNPAPDIRAVMAILLLSVAWAAAFFVGILELQQFVVMTMIQAALFGSLGAACYRKLAGPFLYLYFLVPSGAYLVPLLQAFTARFAVVGLHLLGIPVFSNGSIIEIPAGTFAVAEACAGLRFLVAAVAFGVFFAVITYRSWPRRLAFIALSVLVPIIANGFRALGLIAAAEWIGNPAAALADHIIYGWIFFSFVLLMLVVIGRRFSDHGDENRPSRRLEDAPVGRASPLLQTLVVCTVFILAAATGPVTASLLPAGGSSVLPDVPPEVALPWKEAKGASGWSPLLTAPARLFSQTFVDDSRRMDRVIAIYVPRRVGNPGFSSTDRDADEHVWSFDSAKNEILEVRGQRISAHESVWLRGTWRRVVWSFYVADGRVVSDALSAKWRALRAYLTGSRCLSAYVAVSAMTTDPGLSKTGAEQFLSASEPLDTYLCGVRGSQMPR